MPDQDQPPPSPAYFDEAFGEASRSDQLQRLLRAASADLPDWVESYNFVPGAGLLEVADDLGVTPGDHVLDLACGLGGPGLLVAEHAGTRVVGVDWSRVACRRASEVARARAIPAAYVTASGDALPMAQGSVRAAMCLDAIRFIPGFGLPELARVLEPGARLVVTAWEVDGDSPTGPAVHSWAAVLETGGFVVKATQERPQWIEYQRAVYEAAQRQAETGGDLAVQRVAAEAGAVVPHLHTMRRILVVAEAA